MKSRLHGWAQSVSGHSEVLSSFILVGKTCSSDWKVGTYYRKWIFILNHWAEILLCFMMAGRHPKYNWVTRWCFYQQTPQQHLFVPEWLEPRDMATWWGGGGGAGSYMIQLLTLRYHCSCSYFGDTGYVSTFLSLGLPVFLNWERTIFLVELKKLQTFRAIPFTPVYSFYSFVQS